MDAQFWLWLTTAVMLVGGGVILLIGKRRTAEEEIHTVLHGIVPIIAACSYFAMAIGQGSVVLPLGAPAETGRVFYFARYIDWSFTTPLLLLTLATTSQHSGMRRHGAVAGLLLADLMMILTALFFGLSDVPWIKWTWFLVSCVAFLAVFYVIWVSLLGESAGERGDVQRLYRRNAAILTVLWLAYPVVLAAGDDGLAIVGTTLGVGAIAALDFVSKVVYGLMTISGHSKVVERDMASQGRQTMPRLAA